MHGLPPDDTRKEGEEEKDKKPKSMKQRSAKSKAQRKARRRRLENKKYIESGLSWYRFVQKNKEKRRDQRCARKMNKLKERREKRGQKPVGRIQKITIEF